LKIELNKFGSVVLIELNQRVKSRCVLGVALRAGLSIHTAPALAARPVSIAIPNAVCNKRKIMRHAIFANDE
jgi:hypothetical protein